MCGKTSARQAVLIPVQGSVFDENATLGFIRDIEDIKRVRKGKTRIDVIANRIRPSSRAVQRLDAFLGKIDHAPLAHLSERAIYGEMAGQGMSRFDRDVASLRPIKEQWAPIFDALNA